MRILFVTKFFPFPLDTGSKIRTFHLIKQISEHAEVYLFSVVPESDPPAKGNPLERHCRDILVVPVTKTLFAKILKFVQGIFGPMPHELACNRDRTAIRTIRALVRDWKINLICCEEFSAAGNINIPETTCPVFLDAHNSDSMLLERMSAMQGSLFLKWYYRLQAWKTHRWEARVAQASAGIFAVSKEDAEYFESFNEKVYLIPNGVDRIEPQTAKRRPPLMLFVGRLDYPPNQDGVAYFVDEVLPQIKAAVPEARLLVVGRNPSAKLLRRRSSYVEIRSDVDDLSPCLASAAVCVVPLRAGGGTRLKILEAFGAGVPVVSTSIGAEGLDVQNGKHLLLADDPAEFAECVTKVLENPLLRASLASEALRLTEEKYLWSRIAEKAFRAFSASASEHGEKDH